MEASVGGDVSASPEEFHSLVRHVRRVDLHGFDATGIKSTDVHRVCHAVGAVHSGTLGPGLTRVRPVVEMAARGRVGVVLQWVTVRPDLPKDESHLSAHAGSGPSDTPLACGYRRPNSVLPLR